MPLKVKMFGRHGSDYVKVLRRQLGDHTAFMDEVDELIKNKWIKKSMKELMITKEQMYVDGIARIIQEHAAYVEKRAQEHEELLAREEAIRYAEIQQEAEMEMNFCPECGRPVNRDIFGGLPKFCTSCGRKVR